MNINLSYYLGKNKIDLKKFCEQMKFNSYNDVVVYCLDKNINCDLTQEEYDTLFPKEKKKQNEEKIISKPKPEAKPKTRRRGRKPKAKSTRNSDSKNNS